MFEAFSQLCFQTKLLEDSSITANGPAKLSWHHDEDERAGRVHTTNFWLEEFIIIWAVSTARQILFWCSINDPTSLCEARYCLRAHTDGRLVGLMSPANAAWSTRGQFPGPPLPSRHYALETIPQPL